MLRRKGLGPRTSLGMAERVSARALVLDLELPFDLTSVDVVRQHTCNSAVTQLGELARKGHLVVLLPLAAGSCASSTRARARARARARRRTRQVPPRQVPPRRHPATTQGTQAKKTPPPRARGAPEAPQVEVERRMRQDTASRLCILCIVMYILMYRVTYLHKV